MYRVTTNACLDVLNRWPKSVESAVQLLRSEAEYEPSARYERREAVALAFAAALQCLPPLQRAVLVLREVLGFSAAEVAELLGTTVPAVNSALQRARKALDERVPEISPQPTTHSLGAERTRAVVQRFVHAFEGGDVGTIVGLLTKDERELRAA